MRVQTNLQCVFQHIRNEPGEEWGRKLEARVRVNFYEVRFELIVYHKVQSKHLEAVQSSLGVKFIVNSSKYISGYLIHLRFDVSFKAYVQVAVVFVNKHLKLVVR